MKAQGLPQSEAVLAALNGMRWNQTDVHPFHDQPAAFKVQHPIAPESLKKPFVQERPATMSKAVSFQRS
jgi:hypothetical protein